MEVTHCCKVVLHRQDLRVSERGSLVSILQREVNLLGRVMLSREKNLLGEGCVK